MTRVVVDSNIVIAAIFWAGNPYKIISKGLKGKFELLTSIEIIAEVSEKLRLKFNLPEENIVEQVNIMANLFQVVEVTSIVSISRDADDNKVIACAIDGKADYIVTGDSDLLLLKSVKNVKIFSPSEFLKLF